MRSCLAVVVLLTACNHGPKGVSAGDVCHQLEAAGVAAKCQVGSMGDVGLLGKAASEFVTFDLPSVQGKTGRVLRFRTADAYADAVAGYEAAAMLVGPHRYGSAKALIFVQLNNAAPTDVGAKAAAVVTAL